MTPPVADVPQANLFPQAFPADSFPQFVWEEGERPATLPEQAWTTETTHRDGQQGGYFKMNKAPNDIHEAIFS